MYTRKVEEEGLFLLAAFLTLDIRRRKFLRSTILLSIPSIVICVGGTGQGC
jgi:hypothetical protein